MRVLVVYPYLEVASGRWTAETVAQYSTGRFPMPQFIDFVIGGERVGTLRTGNLGNSSTTYYRVWWCTGTGWQEVGDFDTGIECQPCPHCQPKDAETDRKCDFTHARRAVAAMALAADKICGTRPDQDTSFEGIQLHLRTNGFYRGVINIQPSDRGELTLALNIGGVTGRIPGAYPPTRFEDSKLVAKPNCSPLQATFQVIMSERKWLLGTLARQINQPVHNRVCGHRKAEHL